MRRYNKGKMDPWVLLALEVLDHAVRDAHSIASKKARRRFQPGVDTNPRRLEVARKELLDWVQEDDPEDQFVFLCRGLGMTADEIERRKAKVEGILKYEKTTV